MMTPSPTYGIHSRKHHARQDFFSGPRDRAVAGLGGSVSGADLRRARFTVPLKRPTGGRGRDLIDRRACVFFSAIGSVLDFTATWDELGRAKTWWYFVQRWYFWIVPDRQT